MAIPLIFVIGISWTFLPEHTKLRAVTLPASVTLDLQFSPSSHFNSCSHFLDNRRGWMKGEGDDCVDMIEVNANSRITDRMSENDKVQLWRRYYLLS